jgi:hypothetical protein
MRHDHLLDSIPEHQGRAGVRSILFEEIKKVSFDAEKPPSVVDLGGNTPLPASQIYTKWFLDKAREFDLPYIKRTYMTKKFTSPDWFEWFQGRVSEIIGSKENLKGEPGLWISS